LIRGSGCPVRNQGRLKRRATSHLTFSTIGA
jgi:hypothetical protein